MSGYVHVVMSKTLWTLIAVLGLLASGMWIGRGDRGSPSASLPSAHVRVVSLAPSVTELLFALGAGDHVVGVTDRCDYPPEATRIERIGGFGKPNMEKLLALAPDLVVVGGPARRDLIQSLHKSGMRTLEVQIRSFDEMFQTLRLIGQAVGMSPQAETLIARMQGDLQTIAAEKARPSGQSSPRVFVELWDKPLTTAGGPSFLDEVIARAGGVNVAHELAQPHPRINAEQVIDWNPDVVVVAHMAHGGDAAEQLATRIGWSGITAVRQQWIIGDIPPDCLLRPGPRLMEGIKLLTQRLRNPPHVEITVNEGEQAPP
ncbi:MAG: cobalamin-binding protein [Planctomycetota bacterium]|nr:cobalamin-binding protein [Planctomycetota bacterium]